MIIVFYVQTDTPKIRRKIIMAIMKEVYDDVHIKFGDMDKDFLTSYYRDEMKAKGIDADYDVRLATTTKKEIQLITIPKVQ